MDASFAVFLKAPQEDGLEARRRVGSIPSQRRRRLRKHLRTEARYGVAIKRALACDELIKDDPEGPDVGPGIDRAPIPHLLR